MAGLVPAIPIAKALCAIHRDYRDIPNQVEDRRPVMTGRELGGAPHTRDVVPAKAGTHNHRAS